MGKILKLKPNYTVWVEKSGPVLTSTYELGQVYFTKALEATQGF